MKYAVVLHKDPQSDFSVSVPDLPGCFSAGSTIDEALSMAKEAIACHIEGMLLDREPIPLPQAVEIHRSSPEFADGMWALVEVDMGQFSTQAKRINITLPEYLLHTVDDYAKKHGETRSELLTQAVCEYMNAHP